MTIVPCPECGAPAEICEETAWHMVRMVKVVGACGHWFFGDSTRLLPSSSR